VLLVEEVERGFALDPDVAIDDVVDVLLDT
jgi:hypothetical protein